LVALICAALPDQDFHHSDSLGGCSMKAFAAALTAVGILYVVDYHYNDGRYATVIERAVRTVLPG
jgi:SRSO17 transposase